MSHSFFSKKYKDELDLSYKYGKLYAINLKIDTEEKDLDNTRKSSPSNANYKEELNSKIKIHKHDRDEIYKELSDLSKKL